MFGLPDKFISDRGPQFASKAFIELLKLLGVKSTLSTAYHPQSDGITEQMNQEIEAYLSITVLSTQKIGYFLYTYWNLLIKSKTC
jgi:transposase InsO family protein